MHNKCHLDIARTILFFLDLFPTVWLEKYLHLKSAKQFGFFNIYHRTCNQDCPQDNQTGCKTDKPHPGFPFRIHQTSKYKGIACLYPYGFWSHPQGAQMDSVQFPFVTSSQEWTSKILDLLDGQILLGHPAYHPTIRPYTVILRWKCFTAAYCGVVVLGLMCCLRRQWSLWSSQSCAGRPGRACAVEKETELVKWIMVLIR